jgi:flagellar biosynthesis/type III secretory pathway protein FliH
MGSLDDIMDHEVLGPKYREGLEKGREEGLREGLQEGLVRESLWPRG